MLELNRIYNCDCMEGMKQIPDKYFELAIVDPPYGMRDLGAQTGGEKGILQSRAYRRSKISAWDKAPKKEYFDEIFRVSKNQIIWGGNYFDLPPTRCFVVWDKVQPWENFSQVEYAWTNFGLPAKLFKFDNRTGGKIHPTQKPVALYKWLLKNYAKPGDKIIDTHMGSGSSVIACYDMEFDYMAFEIDKDYFEAANKRIEDHKAQTRMVL